MAQVLSTVNPDYDDLVAQFQNKLALKDSWIDLLTSATGQTLIEYIAGIGELDQYAIERVFQEMFTETARLDSTIYGISKMLGIRLSRKTPAVTAIAHQVAGSGAPINGLKRLNSVAYPSTVPIVIPAYSQFSSDKGLLFNRETIRFDANVLYGYQLEDDGVTRKDIALYEGTVNRKSYLGTGTDFFSIISAEENFTISDSDVVVQVNAVVIPRQTAGLWNNPSAAGWQDLTTSRGQLHVLFGTNVTGGSAFGTVPAAGDTVTLTYVTTKGAAGNAGFSNAKTNCTTYSGLIDTSFSSLVNPLVSGGDEDPAALYQRISPRMFAADQGERGVTEPDYNVIALRHPDVVDCKLLGQRDTFPDKPSYLNAVKVIKYPRPTTDPSGMVAYDDFLEYMESRTMFSMRFWPRTSDSTYGLEPYDIQQFTYVPTPPLEPGGIFIVANVFCNNLADLNTVRDIYIKPAIRAILDEVGDTPNVGRISRNLYRSDIYNAIKNAHESIDFVSLVGPQVDVWAEMIPPTIGFAGVPQSPGGLLVPGTTYYYYLSVITQNPVGETLPKGPVPITITAGNSRVHLQWPLLQNYQNTQYTGWNIYRRDGSLSAPANLVNPVPLTASTASYTDGANPLPVSPMPTSSTAGTHIVRLAQGWTNNIAANIRMFYTGRDPI